MNVQNRSHWCKKRIHAYHENFKKSCLNSPNLGKPQYGWTRGGRTLRQIAAVRFGLGPAPTLVKPPFWGVFYK